MMYRGSWIDRGFWNLNSAERLSCRKKKMKILPGRIESLLLKQVLAEGPEPVGDVRILECTRLS